MHHIIQLFRVSLNFKLPLELGERIKQKQGRFQQGVGTRAFPFFYLE